MDDSVFETAVRKLLQLGSPLSVADAEAFLQTWPLTSIFGKLVKPDLDLLHVRDICTCLRRMLGTHVGVERREEWLPSAVMALSSQTSAIQQLAKDSLRQAIVGEEEVYPLEFRKRVVSSLLDLLVRETRDVAHPSSLVSEHLLCEKPVATFLMSDAALRAQLVRAGAPPNPMEARLRAATLALRGVTLQPALADELLPTVARLLYVSKLDVLGTMGAVEALQAAVAGRAITGAGEGLHASTEPEIAAIILDHLREPLINLARVDDPALSANGLVALCTLVGVMKRNPELDYDWKRHLVLSQIGSILHEDDIGVAVAAILALSLSAGGALEVAAYDQLLARVAALALGDAASSSLTRRGACRALSALISVTDPSTDGIRETVLSNAVDGWPATLTEDRGSAADRATAKSLLLALLKTPWGAAAICRAPDALRAVLSNDGEALETLHATCASEDDEQRAADDDRRALAAARSQIASAVAEAKTPAPQVATIEL